MHLAAFLCTCLVTPALAACGSAPGARGAGAGASLSPVRYVLAVDESLERMTETVCSEGPWTERLVPIHAEGRQRLVRVRIVRADATIEDLALRAGDGALVIPTARLADGDCVQLVLDLASPGGTTNGCLRGDGFVTCASSAWLFAAEPWRPGARHRVTLSLPEGMSVSPAFARDEAGLYLDERSYRFVGYAAFGRLATLAVPVPGGCTTVTLPTGSPLRQSPYLVPWVARAGLASAQITGTATARDAAITVVPLPSRGAPVLFGMAGRGVVPSVLVLASEAPGPELVDDWTLVHELSHLAVPYVPSEDAWLSEGLATYYQEVLRARAGSQSPEAAWRAIDDGLRRGASDGTGRTLREESRAMHVSRAYVRVYWAGAAIALLLDVELRRRGLGTLDDRIARVIARRDHRLGAEALLAALDDEHGIVREIASRWLDTERFPETAEAYAALGLARDAGGLRLGPGGALREAIMNPLASVASNGACPAAGLDDSPSGHR